jgi:hypothetical protein
MRLGRFRLGKVATAAMAAMARVVATVLPALPVRTGLSLKIQSTSLSLTVTISAATVTWGIPSPRMMRRTASQRGKKRQRRSARQETAGTVAPERQVVLGAGDMVAGPSDSTPFTMHVFLLGTRPLPLG